MFTRRIAVAAVAASALVVFAPTSATATPGTPPTTKLLTTHVVEPFNLAITSNTLYVADGGLNVLARVRADGSLKTIAKGPAGGEVAGVAVSKGGRYIAYTTTEHSATNPEENSNGTLHIRDKSGATKTVSTFAYENRVNPDKVNHYGVTDPNPSQCVKDTVAAAGIPLSYTGIKDSHPFSVAAYGRSSWVIADAAGNDLLKVDRRGHVSTVAVLPVQPVTFTAELAGSLGLPDCVIGITYNFEPVPTDVEVGRDGYLYVSTLSGAPANGSSVYRVNPRNGHTRLLATGFAGATNLALFKGKIYVTELFGGQISVVKNGVPAKYLALPGALSVEAGRGHLYAGTGVTGPGSIVKIVKGHPQPIS